MGMNASAKLWYGAYCGLPDSLQDDEDFYDGVHTVDGINVSPIWAYDSLIGIGGIVTRSWWGDKDVVDLDRVPVVKAAVDKFLDEHRVEGERNLYLLALLLSPR